MDDLGWDVLQKLYIGLCIQYIVSVYASSVTFLCVHRELNTQKCEIFLCPHNIRGCAHVKVYLKLFNEA